MDMKYLVLFALLVLPFSFAVSPQGVRGTGIEAAMIEVGCKTDFTVGVINSVDSAVNSSNLSRYATKLQADVTALQGYADRNDSEGFRSYVKGTYETDLRSTNSAVVDLRKSVRGNATRGSMRSDYQNLRGTFESCRLAALKQYANAKVNGYERLLAQYNNKITNLSAKGIDTSILSTIVSDAQSQIVDPLKSAISSATNGSQVRMALGEFCLFNGCPNGDNFHLAAKFEIEKLNKQLAYIQANGNETGVQDKITDAQSALASASSALSSVGTNKYLPDQEQAVWSNIRTAAQDIKQILSGVRNNGKGNGQGNGRANTRGEGNK
ncbi:hypothetical protein HZC07_03020 [Candidatus Micrarchaeota archaeon]|nr:hypothetical protein [Candidatus Micrarchaeota archaeon]